jgi:preprotein translocase subunit SecF
MTIMTITTTMTIMVVIVVIAAVATVGGRWGYYSSTMIATQCPKNCDSPPLRSGDSCSAESSHSVQL